MESNMPYIPLRETLAPMEFQNAMNNRMQELALNDPTEIRQMWEQAHYIEREHVKTANKMLRDEQRQKLKEKDRNIVSKGNNIILQVFNGRNSLIYEKRMFSCTIKKFIVWKRVGSEENEWQIHVIGADGNQQISPLYSWKSLDSLKKLQQTILIKFDCTVSSSDRNEAWKWMQNFLGKMRDQEEVLLLPSKPGWFYTGGKWVFWSNRDECSLYINPIISKYGLDCGAYMDKTSINSYLAKVNAVSDINETVGIMLIILMLALFGRIVSQRPIKFGVAIVGETSEQIAKDCLKIFDTTEDLINLDSDRINIVREKVLNSQDTPLFFASANPDSKSTQSRLKDVMSWLQIGHFEGNPVTVPFVFCLQKFSKDFPFDDFLVISAEAIKSQELVNFLQQMKWLAIRAVESGGDYWIERLRSAVKNCDGGADINDPTFALRAAIEKMVPKLLETESSEEIIRKLLFDGESAVQRQLSLTRNFFLDNFKEAVLAQASKGDLLFINREIPSEEIKSNVSVFFDKAFYYFTRPVFERVCECAKIDLKSVLYVKQMLVEYDFLKIYPSNGKHSRELEVDFSIRIRSDLRKNYSGIAIKRSFWDELGGVALYERSKEESVGINL